MSNQTAAALLAVLALVVIVLLRRAPTGPDGYLVYPYLDLGEPGSRGSYYALSECA